MSTYCSYVFLTFSYIGKLYLDSCVPIKYRDCAAGQILINPCSCGNFYQCQTDYTVLLRDCAGGTLFDHNKFICASRNYVIQNEICKETEPWIRCNNGTATNAEISQIAKRCGGNYVGPDAITTPKPGSNGVSAGVIVGVSVALCAVIAVLAILVVYYRRKKKQETSAAKESMPSIGTDNKAYFTEANRESIYAKISEDTMQDPVYNSAVNERPDLPSRPPSQQATTGNDVKMNTGIDVEYLEPTCTLNGNVSLGKDANDQEYVEITPESPTDKAPPDNTLFTPYDNSWQGV